LLKFHNFQEIIMKQFSALTIFAISLATTQIAMAQSGNMMNGGMWGSGWMGGYGGMWTPILLLIVVIGVVAWIVKRGGK
jgi:hypothetical protein